MAMLAYAQLKGLDGTTEATIISRHEGKLLPPGRWKIRFPDNTEKLMD